MVADTGVLEVIRADKVVAGECLVQGHMWMPGVVMSMKTAALRTRAGRAARRTWRSGRDSVASATVQRWRMHLSLLMLEGANG